MRGLFQNFKPNMEKMVETNLEIEYNQIQHFISESNWDHRPVMDKVAQDASLRLSKLGRVGLMIDESSHLKKGRHSVGVAKQYAGCVGKIENCQVAVYGSVSAENQYQLVDCELFLPQEWIDNPKRCIKSGIPEERIIYKSKIDLALEMIERQRTVGTHFDWVGADAFYGNSGYLLNKLDEVDQLFVMEIHSNQMVYLQEPELFVPDRKAGRGRTPSRLKSNITGIEVRKLIESVKEEKWKKIFLRPKDKMEVEGLVLDVFTWDGKSDECRVRKLIVRRKKTQNDYEIKYAFTNAFDDEFSLEELIKMQSQRFFIEQSFRDAKQEAGMSSYQVRGWRAWHHHMAMVMMATNFVLLEKLDHADDAPLLSTSDVRKYLVCTYAKDEAKKQIVFQQMRERHRIRALSLHKSKKHPTW